MNTPGIHAEFHHTIVLRLSRDSVPCDPCDIDAWAGIIHRVECLLEHPVIENLDQRREAGEGQPPIRDEFTLETRFGITDISCALLETQKHVQRVYSILQRIGFKLPDGEPAPVEFNDTEGNRLPQCMVPLVSVSALANHFGISDELEQVLKEIWQTVWWQDEAGVIYINLGSIHETLREIVRDGQAVNPWAVGPQAKALRYIPLQWRQYSLTEGFAVQPMPPTLKPRAKE